MIRWLHISDLHIVERADWSNFEKELTTKCLEYGKIDLVIVTGDFHNFSDNMDFHRAVNFLRKLLGNLELNIENDLFVIPGNHDGISYVESKTIYINAAKSKPFTDTEKWVPELLKAFQDYEDFVKELIPNYPEEHPAHVHSRIWNGKINFIHCNTALAADGMEKTDQLLDVDALAAETYVPDMPNIILAHNSFFDLHKVHQKRVQDAIRANFVCAYLCGDRHEQSVDGIPINGDMVPCIVSCRGAPDPNDSYSTFGMILGEWEGNWMVLKGWCWNSGDGFSEDPKITGKQFSMQAPQATSSTKPTKDCVLNPTEGEINQKTQVEEYTLKSSFVSGYYKLTYQQWKRFNRKHADRPLLWKMSPSQLTDYVNEAQTTGTLKALNQDLSCTLADGDMDSSN